MQLMCDLLLLAFVLLEPQQHYCGARRLMDADFDRASAVWRLSPTLAMQRNIPMKGDCSVVAVELVELLSHVAPAEMQL
jgi:hypothetical protein